MCVWVDGLGEGGGISTRMYLCRKWGVLRALHAYILLEIFFLFFVALVIYLKARLSLYLSLSLSHVHVHSTAKLPEQFPPALYQPVGLL